MHTAHNTNPRQHGAVLVISLLVLLVLTLTGISSLNGSIIEEKMAANSQIASAAFQTAESSIRAACYAERTNPSGAVENDRHNDSPVNHNHTTTIDGVTTTITSTSQHKYNPAAPGIAMSNSSDSIFEARSFEIIGTARIGAIRRIHTQGYRVLNLMRRP